MKKLHFKRDGGVSFQTLQLQQLHFEAGTMEEEKNPDKPNIWSAIWSERREMGRFNVTNEPADSVSPPARPNMPQI